MSRVVIIGGGITGLSAAYRLQRSQALPGAAITLIESSPRLGGKIQTYRENGLVVERGPDSIFTAKPWGLELAKELNLGGHIVGVSPRARRSYIVRNGRLVAAPQGWTQLTSRSIRSLATSPLISFRGKLRMAADLFIPAKTAGDSTAEPDESIGSFFRRRLGQEAVEYLVDPMMGGIHAGDVDRLSLGATHPHFRRFEKEHGGLIRAALAQDRRTPHTPNPRNSSSPPNLRSPSVQPTFVSFNNGLEQLVERLEESLQGIDILKGRRVRSIVCAGGDVGEIEAGAGRKRPLAYDVVLEDGERIIATSLIITSPAYVAAELLAEVSPETSVLLREIKYESVLTAVLVYEESDVGHPLDGSGFVVPSCEVQSITACTWYSSKWAHSAPPGKVVIRAHMGRTNNPAPIDRPDDEIIAAVTDDLYRIMGVDARPVSWWVDRWPKAMPQYLVGHSSLVRSIERSLEETPGILLAGAAYNGLGIPDCVRQGYEAADKLIALAQRNKPSSTQ